jgi:signal recognition particle subunit SRP54
MREVRLAMLEANVSLKLVRQLVERVKARAIGAEVLGSFSPAQQMRQIVNDELIEMLGGSEGKSKPDLGGPPPHRLEHPHRDLLTIAIQNRHPTSIICLFSY